MRTVVTGIGVAAPPRLGVSGFWQGLLGGATSLSEVADFRRAGYPATLAGRVEEFDPAEHLPSTLIPQTDRVTRLALVAAAAALDDAAVSPDELDEYGIGVVTASSSGGFEFGQGELEKLCAKGSEHVSAYQSFAWFYAVNTGQISIRHGIRGAGGVLVGDQAGGLDAIAEARRHVRRDDGLVLTGGVDASLCPWGWVAMMAAGRMHTGREPTAAYLPFDGRACGHVPAEGGALLVLESEDSARNRGVRTAYGEIAGHGATMDAARPDSPERGLSRAIGLALADAGLGPDEIDVVFADAAGTPDLDASEAAAIRGAVGPVPVAVPKAQFGRLCSGAGPVDVVTALLAIGTGTIPHAVHVRPHRELAPGLDVVVGEPRVAEIDTALVLARGERGFNSAVVVRGPTGLGPRPVPPGAPHQLSRSPS